MSGMQGVTTEIEIHAQELEKMRAKINEMIAKETGKAVDDVAKDTDRDYWLDAQGAINYGLVNKICNHRKDLA